MGCIRCSRVQQHPQSTVNSSYPYLSCQHQLKFPPQESAHIIYRGFIHIASQRPNISNYIQQHHFPIFSSFSLPDNALPKTRFAKNALPKDRGRHLQHVLTRLYKRVLESGLSRLQRKLHGKCMSVAGRKQQSPCSPHIGLQPCCSGVRICVCKDLISVR